jgi:hypothetical protein
MILAGDLAAVDRMVAAEFAGLADAGDLRLGSGYVTLVRPRPPGCGASCTTPPATPRRRPPCSRPARSTRPWPTPNGPTWRRWPATTRWPPRRSPSATAPTGARCTSCTRGWSRRGAGWPPAPATTRPAPRCSTGWSTSCAPTGSPGHELHALHDLVRLGHAREVVDRLTELSQTVEGALAPLAAWHARAAADGDGSGLLAVAEEFAELGMVLYAAEAAAAAIPPLRATVPRRPRPPRNC